MTVDPVVFYVMVAINAFMIGLAKGGLGGTLGALATPLLALVMPADQVIGLILPILMFADIFAIAFHWRRWNNKLVLLLLPGAVVGVTIGTFFITNAPTESLRTALGVIVLVFAVYKIFESRLQSWLAYHPRNWHGSVAGTITGFSSALAHTGGPPVSIYLLLQDVTPRVFIATSAIFFFLLNWIKVPYYWYGDYLILNYWHKSFGCCRWFLSVRGSVAGVRVRSTKRPLNGLLVVAALLLIFS